MYARLTADLLTRCILAVGVTLTVAGLIHQHTDDDSGFAQLNISDRVAQTEFGVYGCHGFAHGDQVPLIHGQTFAWRVWVPDGGPVSWREELVLPSPPAEWSGANFIEFRDDGRTAVTAGFDEPLADGIIEHAWSITDGDPPGDYELRLWIDGSLHQVFRFQVQ